MGHLYLCYTLDNQNPTKCLCALSLVPWDDFRSVSVHSRRPTNDDLLVTSSSTTTTTTSTTTTSSKERRTSLRIGDQRKNETCLVLLQELCLQTLMSSENKNSTSTCYVYVMRWKTIRKWRCSNRVNTATIYTSSRAFKRALTTNVRFCFRRSQT